MLTEAVSLMICAYSAAPNSPNSAVAAITNTDSRIRTLLVVVSRNSFVSRRLARVSRVGCGRIGIVESSKIGVGLPVLFGE